MTVLPTKTEAMPRAPYHRPGYRCHLLTPSGEQVMVAEGRDRAEAEREMQFLVFQTVLNHTQTRILDTPGAVFVLRWQFSVWAYDIHPKAGPDRHPATVLTSETDIDRAFERMKAHADSVQGRAGSLVWGPVEGIVGDPY